MKYFVHIWRYGSENIEEFGDLQDARDFFQGASDSDQCFAECIKDENGTIIEDGMKYVIGVRRK